MKNENNKQRNSAPTGAQDSESNLNADRPLGGAACSASDPFQSVLDAMAHQQALPIDELMCGDPVKEEEARVDMMGRLQGVLDSISAYREQSEGSLS